ncbi:hypothetical protein Areg01_89470 [Actinoplanes regularis]|nr:hypothetical protein Areg01_89470 [Actinoplanes regularis]
MVMTVPGCTAMLAGIVPPPPGSDGGAAEPAANMFAVAGTEMLVLGAAVASTPTARPAMQRVAVTPASSGTRGIRQRSRFEAADDEAATL